MLKKIHASEHYDKPQFNQSPPKVMKVLPPPHLKTIHPLKLQMSQIHPHFEFPLMIIRQHMFTELIKRFVMLTLP